MGYSGASIWAWLADEGGGQRGIVAAHTAGGNWPLVMFDEHRIRSLTFAVAQIATTSGQRIELVEYTKRRHVLWVPS